jgi:molybdopterin converting factor small subunit
VVVAQTDFQATVTADPPSAVTVLLFAGAAGIAGTRSFSLTADDPLTVREAFLRLCHVFPGLSRMQGRLLFAANAEYVDDLFELRAGDELSVIPPVSGGAGG